MRNWILGYLFFGESHMTMYIWTKHIVYISLYGSLYIMAPLVSMELFGTRFTRAQGSPDGFPAFITCFLNLWPLGSGA